MLNGIKNFLTFINDNWTSIIVIASLLAMIYRKAKAYLDNANDKKIEIAKAQIRESMLKMITDAEVDYETWNQAGSVKRSQVIQQIFMDYPVLSRMVDQDTLIAWIDEQINCALKELRKIIEQQNKDL